jgi:hypothetical protein
VTWWAQVAQHKRGAHGTLHEPPLFEVERIECISMPRLQEKYLAELQDVAGLCGRRLSDKMDEVDALRVQSYAGTDRQGRPCHSRRS